jgi:hypothetical protein
METSRTKVRDLQMLAGVAIMGTSLAVLIYIAINSWRNLGSGFPSLYILSLALPIGVMIAMLSMLIASMGITTGARIPLLRTTRGGNREAHSVGDKKPENIPSNSLVKSIPIDEKPRDSISPENPSQNSQSFQGSSRSGALEIQDLGLNTTKIDIDGVRNIVKDEVSKAISGVVETIGKISSEVGSIRKDLDDMRSSIESAMMDIRSLLSEISNPFNYMRKFAPETELEGLGININQRSIQEENMAKNREVENAISGASLHGHGMIGISKTSDYEINSDRIEEKLEDIFSGEVSISRLMRLILFVGENLQTLGRDGLVGLVELGVSSGVLPREAMHLVARVISLIEETRLPPKSLAIMLYRLAKSMGVSDREAEFLSIALSGG